VPVLEPDHVDRLIEQWQRERPDLALAPMAIFGRLGRLYALATRSIEAVFRRHGLDIGEFDVLAALRRSGEPFAMTPSALARTLMLSPSGMTNRLDRLESAGFVERRSNPGDRRSSMIALTTEGWRTVDAAVADHVANEAALLAGLTDSEQEDLDNLVRKLLATLPTS
jgi:DNA-binding MarR family transcriptional regulator